MSVSRREIALSCLGALLGLFGACWFSQRMLAGFDPWFIAPMGASAVLLFAVPSSPLAQPWSIVGGNIVSAAIGVACARHVPDVASSAALAGALAIAAMFLLRCLHPPSGAVALTAVLGGPAIKALGYAFVLWPVALDSLLLLMAALLFNVSTRRRYPHGASVPGPAHRTADTRPDARVGPTLRDLHQAMEARGELLDVSEDDLQELFLQAEHMAWKRRSASLRGDALPVVDVDGRLLGIVTLRDFFAGDAVVVDVGGR